MQTKEISALIMQLYAEVFRLHHLIVRYFSSKFTRFLAAFNENAFEDNIWPLRQNYYIPYGLHREKGRVRITS
jgi:hypothetical protein